MDRDELLAASAAGQIVVLDVRPGDEYAAGHLSGAVSIPLDELASRLSEIPADVEVVAYCRGRYCVLSHRAVRLLIDHGFDARLAADGMLEWRADGVPDHQPRQLMTAAGAGRACPLTGTTATSKSAPSMCRGSRPVRHVAEAHRHLDVDTSTSVIDVGGGSSPLVDELLARGFDDITVLDVSRTALDVARRGLDDPHGVTWLHADLLSWTPTGVGVCGTTGRCSTSSPHQPTASPTSASSQPPSHQPERSSSPRSHPMGRTTARASP